MGRGRAKAKQTKVARRLKYESGPDTDLSRLQSELAGGSDRPGASAPSRNDDGDPYSRYLDDDED